MSAYSFSVDPSLLATFLTVADEGRVVAAARALHLSQPAVTAQVRRLERELGTALFLRSARGVSLTPEGRRLYASARAVHELLERSLREAAPGRPEEPALELAASTTIADHVLPPLIAEFVAARPAARVRLTVGNTEEVLEWVAAGKAPIGLVEGHGRAAKVRLEPFVEDEIVPCRGAGVRVDARRPADLGRFRLLQRERGSGTRAVVERALREAGVKAAGGPPPLELGSTEAIKNAVVAGAGVGFLSRWSIRDELLLGRLVPIEVPGLRIRRVFRWALPSGALTGGALAFYRFANDRRRSP